MKKLSFRGLLFCFFCLVLLSSCDSHKKEKAIEVVQKFNEAYKVEDIAMGIKLYPNITKLKGDFYKVDELSIKEALILPNGDILVEANSKWTNPFGQASTHAVKFFIEEQTIDGEKSYKIKDTKNFISFTSSNLYNIAIKGGGIDFSSDTTDLKVSRKLTNIEPTYRAMVSGMRDLIEKSIKYTGFNWSTGYYSDYASGSCTISNVSGLPMKNPKYQIVYRNKRGGDIIATDDGVVCYGWLGAGESKRISWYTSNIPSSVQYASVKVILDPSDDWIEEIILQQDFTGTELQPHNLIH